MICIACCFSSSPHSRFVQRRTETDRSSQCMTDARVLLSDPIPACRRCGTMYDSSTLEKVDVLGDLLKFPECTGDLRCYVVSVGIALVS
jgi:hypothetical protein